MAVGEAFEPRAIAADVAAMLDDPESSVGCHIQAKRIARGATIVKRAHLVERRNKVEATDAPVVEPLNAQRPASNLRHERPTPLRRIRWGSSDARYSRPVASRTIGSANEMASPSGSMQTASRIPSFGWSVGGITKYAPRDSNSAKVASRL